MTNLGKGKYLCGEGQWAPLPSGSSGSFFRDQQGRPILKSHFIAELRKALAAAGLDQSAFPGHSFRIGAAMAAAQAVVPDSTIQILRR